MIDKVMMMKILKKYKIIICKKNLFIVYIECILISYIFIIA